MKTLTINEAMERLECRRIVKITDHNGCDEYYEYDNPESISKLIESYRDGSVVFTYNPAAEEKARGFMNELSKLDEEVTEYLHHFMVLEKRCEY